MGNPRVPAAKNKANGNPSRRDIKPEPVAVEGSPVMPPDGIDESELRKQAYEHFIAVASETPGWIQTTDGVLVELAATHYAQWRALSESARESGDIKERRLASAEATLVSKLLGQLGFTPVDRSRVAAPDKPGMTLADMLLGDDDD